MTNGEAPCGVLTLTESGPLFRTRWMWIAGWAVALIAGLVQAWAYRHFLQADGVSYLDIAHAISQGRWSAALNSYWSPLYPAILGVALKMARLSPSQEIPLTLVVSFVVYAASLGCFHFFLRSLLDAHAAEEGKPSVRGSYALPEWAWVPLGFALFTWTSLQLIELMMNNPDVCVAAVIFLAAGLMLRIRVNPRSWRNYLIFGLVLGVGYWAKAPMFPMAFVFLLAALPAAGNWRIALPRLAGSLGVFLILACPLVIGLSRAEGRLTFGDSGRVNYIMYVDGTLGMVDWQGHVPGTLGHPPKKLLDHPEVYSYAAHVKGTYPLSYDPPFWFDGARPWFNLRGQLSACFANILAYYQLFIVKQGNILAAVVILLLLSAPWRATMRNLGAYSFLLIPPLGALCMYALVHVEDRMVAAYLVLIWLGICSGIRLPASPEFKRVTAAVAISILLTLGVQIVCKTLKDVRNGMADPQRVQWTMAEQLKQMGVAPGDTVASAGNSFNCSWAYMAGVSIVAEAPDWAGGETFWWTADPQAQERVLQAFAKTGAKVVVADRAPSPNWNSNWQEVGNTNYFVHSLIAEGR